LEVAALTEDYELLPEMYKDDKGYRFGKKEFYKKKDFTINVYYTCVRR